MPVDQLSTVYGPGGFGPTGVFRSDVQVFEYTGLAQAYQLWNKPRGVSMCFMFAIAGGGGGGAGFSRAAGGGGGGGGGGATSGISRFMVPAIFLPDVLYVQIGPGGLGGVPGVSSGNGGNGTNSYVLTSKTAAGPNIVIYSGVNVPGGGGGGAVGAAGAAGTVPTIAVVQACNTWGEWFTVVGLVGSLGGASTGAVGVSVSNVWGSSNLVLSPGAGGAGCTTTDFDGGAQTAPAIADFGSSGRFNTGAGLVAAAGTGTGAAIHGSAGVSLWKPFYQSGGAGGGSNNSATAGTGGRGGIGCGGGGGGAGTTAGNGGHGGPGLVVIVSW